MNNIFTLNSSYINDSIIFEKDSEFWIIISFNKKQKFFWKILKKFNYSNSSDFSLEIDLSDKDWIHSINELIQFIESNTYQNHSEDTKLDEPADIFSLWENKIIVWCNCVWWINEHSIYIDYYFDDDFEWLLFKLNLNHINDSILLSKEHTDFIINFLKKHVR